MVTEEDMTLGGKHTMRCTGDAPQHRALDTYVILLTTVAPMSVILNSLAFSSWSHQVVWLPRNGLLLISASKWCVALLCLYTAAS